ncbi:hypothetical protein OSB04_015581 [Centaurea solstitialis]|uniref:F-box domain-containing protein n=1 Tax=Centaurea solstitialis TaxID=347529 RepID=A0AA38TCN8_9ASTR|nr:hypothetical protein OSB04_015581 [Centaurea solstitialis]
MEALPVELTMDILSRLPVKTIIHCKLVCNKWRNLISDSSFVDLHLSGSRATSLIIHQNVNYKCEASIDPGMLKWVEIEDKVDHHGLHYDSLVNLDLSLSMVPIFQSSRISLKGSVNGLICLRQYSRRHNNTCIYNPVTREVLTLPTSPQYPKHISFTIIAYGFGVSSLTGEYKVVRALNRIIRLNGDKSKMVSEAEVYTFGTGQWRNLGRLPYCIYESDVGAVLNDHCHWILSLAENHAPEKIITFDLSTEMFQLFPSPPIEEEEGNCIQHLAVLKGCLCNSVAGDLNFTIWVMKEYGIKNSWHKEVVILEAISKWPEWLSIDYIYLIEGLKDVTILSVDGMSGSLFAFHPRNNAIEKIETFDWLEGWLAYRPSFLKLQNFVSERAMVLEKNLPISWMKGTKSFAHGKGTSVQKAWGSSLLLLHQP